MSEQHVAVIGFIFGAVFGGGGLISLIVARRERQANIDLTDGNAIKVMQEVYKEFAKDTALEIGQMKEEIKMLREIIKKNQLECAGCVNNPNKEE
jgi:hypothetical protein